jgi:hypothetical protein
MKTAAEIGAGVLERLARQAAANRAAGEALRAEVRTVLKQHPTVHLTARQVIVLLARTPPPSLRRMQEILRELRAESSGPR